MKQVGEFTGYFTYAGRADMSPQQVAKLSHARGIFGNGLLIREIVKENHVGFFDAAREVMYRQNNGDFANKPILAKAAEGLNRVSSERFAYLGDIHGEGYQVAEHLDRLVKYPPDVLILIGDIVGTPHFKKLQDLFYQGLTNYTKRGLFSGKDAERVSDDEIIKAPGREIRDEKGQVIGRETVKEGFLKLRQFELELEGLGTTQVAQRLESLSDADIAQTVREYARFSHYGHYASHLPQMAKENLAAGLAENAEDFEKKVAELRKKGTQVVYLEGNWDARVPIDFAANAAEVIPLPKEERLFDTAGFFRQKGYEVYDGASNGYKETKAALHVFLPFDDLVAMGKLSISGNEQSIDAIAKKTADIQQVAAHARQNNKQIILVGHGHPNFRVHTLNQDRAKQVPVAEEDKQVLYGFTRYIQTLRPHEILYGHQHFPLPDSTGQTMDVNTKYALSVNQEGEVVLVEDATALRRGLQNNVSVVSYVPRWDIGQVLIPKQGERNIKSILGKRRGRKPATVEGNPYGKDGKSW